MFSGTPSDKPCGWYNLVQVTLTSCKMQSVELQIQHQINETVI